MLYPRLFHKCPFSHKCMSFPQVPVFSITVRLSCLSVRVRSNVVGVFRMFWGCFECFGRVSNVLLVFRMFWGVLDKLLQFTLLILGCVVNSWGVLHMWATIT